jgi:haloalkane dehalogenase
MTSLASSIVPQSARTAAPIPRPAWLEPDLFPFESRFVDVDGHHIHYVDEGKGPILLLVHPDPSWSFYYRELILGLRDRFRCIALDLPGFGFSTARRDFDGSLPSYSRVVERFIEELGLANITLAVHDSGGPVGLGVAVRQPDWFRSFIIVSTFGWPLTDYPRIRFMLRLVSSWPFRLLNAAFNLLPRAVANIAPRRRKLLSAEKAGLMRIFDSWARRDRILRMFRQLVTQTAYLTEIERGLYSRLSDRPALIMFGEVDPVRALGFDKRWESIFSVHQSFVIAQEQHFAHLGAASELVDHIRSFWRMVEDTPVRSL